MWGIRAHWYAIVTVYFTTKSEEIDLNYMVIPWNSEMYSYSLLHGALLYWFWCDSRRSSNFGIFNSYFNFVINIFH